MKLTTRSIYRFRKSIFSSVSQCWYDTCKYGELEFKYGMNKDIYGMVTDYATNCCVLPPPQYKETTLIGKKRRNLKKWQKKKEKWKELKKS